MPTYKYTCLNEECEVEGFTFVRPMTEHKLPSPCPNCQTLSERNANDWCRNFKLKGYGWYSGGYNGASNGVPNYKEERRKAGKHPHKHPEEK